MSNSSPTTESLGRSVLPLAVVATAGLALRLWAVPPLLPDLDSVNFARALDRFDLSAQAPHFPGYPVFVAMAKAFHLMGAGPVFALALPGLSLWALAAVALGRVLTHRLGLWAGVAGVSVVSLAPLPVLSGGAPASDGAGFCALALAGAAALHVGGSSKPRLAVLAGGLSGLALGIRPSFLPAVLGLWAVVPTGRRASYAVGAVAAVAAWLVPLVAVTGAGRFAHIALFFLRGHASEWGGTIAVQSSVIERLRLLAFDVAIVGLGAPWVLCLACAVGLGRVRLEPEARRVALAAVAMAVPYAAWAFVGQNLLKARHALPLILAVALLVAAAAAAAQEGVARALAVALAAAFAITSAPLAREQGAAPSPAAALVAHAAANLSPEGTMLLTGEEARLFEVYAPQFRAARLADGAKLAREADRLASAGVRVFVTSAAPGVETLASRLSAVARFSCSPLVRTHGHGFTLFRYESARTTLALESP
jgi:hypothetical protein